MILQRPADFQNAIQLAADTLLRRGWVAPQLYLHFGCRFPLEGLFDPQQPVHCCTAGEFDGTGDYPGMDGDAPQMRMGHIGGVPAMVVTGPRTLADGEGMLPVLFPDALAAALGCRSCILVDCGVSLNPDLKISGWAMLIDFINRFALSPLDGLHRMLKRHYPDLGGAISQYHTSEVINALAGNDGPVPLLCTAAGVPGFHVCTPAEAGACRKDGADMVVHDMVLHVIFSHAMGMDTAAMALAGAQILPGGAPPGIARQEMLDTAAFKAETLIRGLRQAAPALVDAQFGEPQFPAPADDIQEIIAANIRRCASRRSPLRAFLRSE